MGRLDEIFEAREALAAATDRVVKLAEKMAEARKEQREARDRLDIVTMKIPPVENDGQHNLLHDGPDGEPQAAGKPVRAKRTSKKKKSDRRPRSRKGDGWGAAARR